MKDIIRVGRLGRRLYSSLRPNFNPGVFRWSACTDEDHHANHEAYHAIKHLDIHEAIQKFIKVQPFGTREFYFRAIEKRLESPMDLNAQDARGNSVLHILTKYTGHQHSIKPMALTLLNHGLNPDLVNQEGRTAAHFLFDWLSYAKFDDIDYRFGDKESEYVLRQVLNKMHCFNMVDKLGWSLLHHAVYKQRFDIAMELARLGVDWQKTTHKGITPYHLAIYHRNQKFLTEFARMGLEVPTDVPTMGSRCFFNSGIGKTSIDIGQISPLFFAQMATKLRTFNWIYWQPNRYPQHCPYPFTSMFIPLRFYADKEERQMISTTEGSKALNSLYQTNETSFHKSSPMYCAILDKNLDEIRRLLRQGWNAYIESDYMSYSPTIFSDFFYPALDELYRKTKDDALYMAIMKLLIQYPTSGVSLESEFHRLIKGANCRSRLEQATLLLDMGLTPASFKQHMGRDFYSTISYLSFYDSERPILPDWTDYYHYLLDRFPEESRHVPQMS